MKKKTYKKMMLTVAAALALTMAGCGKEASNPGKDASGASEGSEGADAGGTSGNSETVDTPEALFELAVEDSVFAEESEIESLVSLTKDDKMVTWDDQGRVLLCTWHNYPDSYPVGETVTIEWGPVWTFTDLEIDSRAEELKAADDPEMRLKQIIAFAPDSEHSTVTGFWVDPADVCRPAYQNDPTDGTMTTAFADEENVDEAFKEWFDENILWSYFYGDYPWTRLGYTYDWADNGTEYGMTEFIVNSGAEVEVAFTETTEEFFEKLFQ